MSSRPYAAIVLATAIAALVPAPAASALGLTDPQRVTSHEEKVKSFDVGADRRGHVFAAWSSQSRPPDGRGSRVHFARLDERGRPLDVLDVGSARRVGIDLATDPGGESTIVFPNRRGGHPTLYAVHVDRSGHADPKVRLNPDGEAVSPFSFHAEPSPEGGAFVSWAGPGGVHVVKVSAEGGPGPVRVIPTDTITGQNYDDGPDLAVGPDGTAAVAWTSLIAPTAPYGGSEYSAFFARIAADGTPSEPQQIATQTQNFSPIVALGSNDEAAVAYLRVVGPLQSTVAFNQLVRISGEGDVGPAVNVTTGYYSPLSDLALRPDGEAIVALGNQHPGPHGSHTDPATAAVSAGGSVDSVQELGRRGGGPSLATSGRKVFAAWTEFTPGEGGGFSDRVGVLDRRGKAREVASAGSASSLALAASGNGPALLLENEGSLRAVLPNGR